MTRAIEVDVYESNGSTLVGTLASDRGRQWLDDLSAEGSYSIESRLAHADEAMLTWGRILRFKINGTARWQGLVEEVNPVIADPQGRQAGRVIGAAGRGLLALFEDVSVYPELGLGLISPDTRYFGFASLDYDDTSWASAVELKQQDDTDSTKPWFGAPKDWPDPSAKWVGPTGGATPPVDPGDIYLRGTFTVASGQGAEYRFYISADDGFELYVDGNKVASEQLAGLWGETRYFDLILDEGSHLVAIKGVNFDRPVAATNVFGVIATVAKLTEGGQEYGTIVSGTSAGTKMLAYPSKAPGMTPGKILDVLLDEAQARGCLTGLTWDFTATLDSNGNAWPDEIDVAFPVGGSLLDVIRHLVDEHACDVAMAATGLVLHAYVSKGSDLSATVKAQYGVNIGRLAAKKSKPLKNVGLSRTTEGRWVESTAATSVTAFGRKEVGLSLGSAPSDDAADRQTAAFFADNAFEVQAITDLQLEAVTDVPYVDFSVGDIIEAPLDATVTGTFRVASIRVAEDAAGQPIYTPELVFTGTLWATSYVLWDDPVATWGGV